jgi:hypothetical protein
MPSKLEARWVGKRFRIDGLKARGSFVVPTSPGDKETLSLRAYLYDFPKGTVASVGGQKVTTSDRRTVINDIDFSDKVTAKLPIKDAVNGSVDLGLTLSLAVPKANKLTIKAPPQRIGHAIARRLSEVETGAVSFKGESDDAGPLDAIAVVQARSRSRRMRALGAGATLGDLDWVAIERTADEPKLKKCPRGEGKTRTVRAFDTLLKVFNRRDGKLVTEHTFKGTPNCDPPRSARGENQREVDGWLIAELKKRGGDPGKDPIPAEAEPAPRMKMPGMKPPHGVLPSKKGPRHKPPAPDKAPPMKPSSVEPSQ